MFINKTIILNFPLLFKFLLVLIMMYIFITFCDGGLCLIRLILHNNCESVKVHLCLYYSRP